MSTDELLKRSIMRLSTVLLPVSLGLIIIALTLALLGNVHFPRFSVSGFSILCGMLLGHTALVLKTRLRFYLASIFLLLIGALLLFIDIGLVVLPLPGVWPFLMLFLGISFLVAGSLARRRAEAVYVVPALAFAALGTLFLLLSTDLIPVSKTLLALLWCPLLVLPTAVSVLIWLSRKGPKNEQ